MALEPVFTQPLSSLLQAASASLWAHLAGATIYLRLLVAGLGIANKQFEDEAAVVRTESHGALDVRDEFGVDLI